MENETKEGNGAVIATAIILLVIILGGIYFWTERTSMDIETTENVGIELNDSFATTTDTDALENELNSVDTENVDSSLYNE